MSDTPIALIEESQRLRPRSRFWIVLVSCPFCGHQHDHIFTPKTPDKLFHAPCKGGSYVLNDYLSSIAEETDK